MKQQIANTKALFRK